jgi:CCR4-NOT transcriptional complex subunit CAF120
MMQFTSLLGSITTKPTATQPSRQYPHVFTLTTAGANLILFSSPTAEALVSWGNAIRLSQWEKSRLEEIYTAALLRTSLPSQGKDWPSPVPQTRRVEGWARVRVSGHTDWKRVYIVVGSNFSEHEGRSQSPSQGKMKKPNRMSALFSRSSSPPPTPGTPASANGGGDAFSGSQLHLLTSNKPKDRKKPLLVVTHVTQAFAVYPERPEVIPRSTILKIEGKLAEESPELGTGPGIGQGQGKNGRDGWVLIMPEQPEGWFF